MIMTNQSIRSKLADALIVLIAAVLYALFARAILSSFPSINFTSVIHPWIGVALAILIRNLRRYLPGVFLGTITVDIVIAGSVAAGLPIAFSSTLTVLCGAWLISRSSKFDPGLLTLRDYLRLLFLGGCISGFIGATARSGILLVNGVLQTDAFFSYLFHWWMGDALTVALLTSSALIFLATKFQKLKPTQSYEAIFLLGLSFLVGQVVFLGWFGDIIGTMPVGYWMFLFVAWVAVRLGTPGTIFVLMMTAVQALSGVYFRVGFFGGDAINAGLANYWLYMMILSVVGMALATYVSERGAAAAQIQRLSHLYAALTHCNQAIVRCSSKEELLPEICRIAVQFGGMKAAWVGFPDETNTLVRPVAAEGIDINYLQGIRISLDGDDPNGRGPSGTVIRDNQPFWCQDFKNDPRTAPWHAIGERLDLGATAAVPLHRNGKPIGAFSMYTEQANSFDEAARDLLLRLGQDISYALENYEHEAERKRNEEILRGESLQTLSQRDHALREITQGVVITNAMRQATYINDAFIRQTGYLKEEVLGRSCSLLQGPDTSQETVDRMRSLLNSNLPFQGEILNYRKDGTTFWNDMSITPVFDEEGKLLQWVGVQRDITEQKQAEAQIHLAANVFAQGKEAIVISNADRNIVMVNKAFSDITGYSEIEVLGKAVRTLYSGYKSEEIYGAMIESLEKLGHWQGEIWNRRKNGEVYLEWLSISCSIDADGKLSHYVGIFSDITQHREAEERMHWLSHFDPLTGLPNRTLLEDRCKQAISMVHGSGDPMALMFLDLDHFKNINETIGHRCGDLLLVELANRMTFITREQDTVSRLGGDDFVLALPGINASGAAQIAERVMATIARPFEIEEHEISISGSIGIAMYPVDGSDFETLIKCADMAMFRAKQDGRNNYCFFTADIQTRTVRTLQLDNALRRVLERGQLLLHYQPQVSLHDGCIIGVEALLRWQHPEFGMISPVEFIPIAESNGMILSIGEWVMLTAARQMKAWMDEGFAPMIMSVNLSAVQFRHPSLPDLVMRVLDEVGLSSEYFELELTESAAMENPLAATAMMDELYRRGIRMSIDDFGTGYSSLAHLKRFKVYKLKIDRSFVSDIPNDSDDKAIVCAVINLAGGLGLQTIAEGVETEEQLSFLRENGCQEMQGYFYSRPLPADQLAILLRGKTPQQQS
jgi:diguanylate cyclase (GGDEF)-like protein/PAS domain S-box-containing protein